MIQVSDYMILSGINQAILFTYVVPNNGKVSRLEKLVEEINGRIIIISSEASA